MSPSHPLRIPQFRNLWLGQAISQFGDAVYYAIFMFMVAKVTGSIAAVGYVGAIETLPFLLFSPYAGVLADRIDRRRIMLLSDVVCGLLLAGFALYIAFEPKPAFWLIASVAFTLSTVRSFFIPAKNAAIPRLVPASSLLEANAFSQMTQSFMLMGGVALAAGVSAVLYAIAPGEFFVGTFALNAISFLGSAYFIAKLPPIAPEGEIADRHPLKEIVAGGKYAIGRPELLVLMGLQALLMLCISPFFPIYVAANESWFGGKPNTLLLFEFAFMFGHILGSLWVGKSSSKWPGRAYIVGSFFVGLTVAGLAFSQHIALFILFNFAAGLAVPWASIPVMTYLCRTRLQPTHRAVHSLQLRCGIGGALGIDPRHDLPSANGTRRVSGARELDVEHDHDGRSPGGLEFSGPDDRRDRIGVGVPCDGRGDGRRGALGAFQ